jgi:hypothetical protein
MRRAIRESALLLEKTSRRSSSISSSNNSNNTLVARETAAFFMGRNGFGERRAISFLQKRNGDWRTPNNNNNNNNNNTNASYATKGRGQSAPKGFTPPAAMAAKATSNNINFNPFQSSSNALAEPYRGRRKMPSSMTKIPRYLYDIGLNKAKDIYCTSKVTSAIKGFDLNMFKRDASILYEEISRAIANNNLSSCRRDVSDKVMQELKQEQKRRTKNGWSRIRWNLSEKGVENVSVVQGRMMATSQDLTNAFAQFTVRFESRQEFGAYDDNDRLVAGDSEEVGANLKVVDHWVFERGIGPVHKTNSRWRLCARLIVEE